MAGVEPPTRTEEAKQQAVGDAAAYARYATGNAADALIWSDGAARWAARTAWDCRRGGRDLLRGILGGIFGR